MQRREDQIVRSLTLAVRELGQEVPSSGVHVEIPAREEHGDYSTNLALLLSKQIGQPPLSIAESLIATEAIRSLPHLVKVEIARPGFINFTLAPTHLHELMVEVKEEGRDLFARHDFGDGTRMQLEFVSANPTGPLHIGNGWWASYGDALGRVLERCGYSVTREYYVNDTGGQIRTLGASILARRRGEEPPEGGYLGDYIVEQASRYLGEEDIVEAGKWAAEENLATIQRSLERLNIVFDTWFSQASIEDSGAVANVVDLLFERGAVFENDGALWLRSTEWGDTRDRVLRKSNGDYTYLAGDITYHYNKFVIRAFDAVIDIFGADHHGQVASMRAAMAALGIDVDRLEIRLGQIVALESGDQAVKFSKRAGTAVSLDWLVDEVGPSVTRLLALSTSLDRATTINLAEAKERSMENPAYYIQYAHARMAALDRMRSERGIAPAAIDDARELGVLVHPREIRLMREIIALPEVVRLSALERAPHRVTTWLKGLAAAFHGFYHDCPVLMEGISDELVAARLYLVEVARVAIVTGLDLLGVDAPEEM
ncbi:MAG: arginine--tRNA ligase [Acidimicrobiales bacterium]